MAQRSLMPFGWGRSRLPAPAEDFFEPFRSLQQEMDRVFADFMGGMPMAALAREGGGMMLRPRIDVAETEKEIIVKAELPGLEDKDINLSLSNDVLTIRGEKRSERDEKAQDYHVMERSFGTFARSISLPFTAEADKVKAKFDKGILTVTVPKPEGAQDKTKQIPIERSA